MDDKSFFDDGRLSRIETLWSVVRRAHESDAVTAASAQQLLLQRYGGAIRRYLIGALKNQDLADEMFQEFAFKFVKGDFKSANPERGKFRSFVKTILFRMVALHFRKKSSRKELNMEEMPEPISTDAISPSKEDDELFLQSWRDDVLARTWSALDNLESSGPTRYATILRLRVQNPAATSDELAELMSAATNKPVSSGGVRVQVHRAREKFANLLIETIADSLTDADRGAIEAELVDLRLIDYCRDALDSYQD